MPKTQHVFPFNQRLEKLLIFTGVTQREVSEIPELMFVIFSGLNICRK